MRRFAAWFPAALALGCSTAWAVDAAQRPNIVVILADDVGYSDLACYGGEIHTPRLDELAENGLRFTQFYNTGRCCPTRAALLTGLYSHQAGMGHMTGGPGRRSGAPSYAGELSHAALTLAEVLKSAGYATYMAGKWHLTGNLGTGAAGPIQPADKRNWPLQRGFDRYYGTLRGAVNYFDPGAVVIDNEFASPLNDPGYRPADFYFTDALSDYAARFVSEHKQRRSDQPFFLYLAYTAAHWPLHAKESDIAKYKGAYDGGYETVRMARLNRMQRMGLLNPSWRIAPTTGDWSNVDDKVWEARCMETYAAMVDCMDQGIGRVLDALRATQQIDNTLILYMQDNGGCAETIGRNQPFQPRPAAPTFAPLPKERVLHVDLPVQTRDGFPVRQGVGVMPGPGDTHLGYGPHWANVSNTPFREYKHWEHEGGVSSPLIVHWPSGIPADRRGALERQPAHLIDVMPTCLAIAGARRSIDVNGLPIPPLEGISLVPALAGDALHRTQPLFWEHEGNRAVRSGDWKLVSKHLGEWELYNMADDRTEMNDLALRDPARVQEMAAQWEAWAQRVGVLPWPPAG